MKDIDTAAISAKINKLLVIGSAVRKNGRLVTPEMAEAAKEAGATEREIHDTALIAALFSLSNGYVDGLASITPAEPKFCLRLAHILVDKGYLSSKDRHAQL